jgi:hypothetical protein
MTNPIDPWSSPHDPPPFDLASPEDDEAGIVDELRDDEESDSFDRLPSDALTVPINSRGMTRPLAWSRPAPRAPLSSRRLLDQSTLPALLLGIGIGVLLTSIVAALIIASMADSAAARRAVATTPRPTHGLPTVTPTRPPTATPVPSVEATFDMADTTTQGAWQGVYGNQGAIVIGDTQQLPASIQVTPNGAAGGVWAPTTPDPRAPQKITNPADRIAACWYSGATFSFDVTITDGQAHHLALYLLDWDSQNRSEAVSVIDPATGTALDTRIVTGFINGQYLVWTVRGHIVVQITNNAGSVNAVMSALFFSNA